MQFQANNANEKDSEINSLMSNKMNLVQREANFTFYDMRVIWVKNFLSKNEFGSTSDGVLLLNKLND